MKNYLTAQKIADELGIDVIFLHEALTSAGLETSEIVGKKTVFTITKEGEKYGMQKQSGFGPFISWDKRKILKDFAHLKAKQPELKLLEEIRDLLEKIAAK